MRLEFIYLFYYYKREALTQDLSMEEEKLITVELQLLTKRYCYHGYYYLTRYIFL